MSCVRIVSLKNIFISQIAEEPEDDNPWEKYLEDKLFEMLSIDDQSDKYELDDPCYSSSSRERNEDIESIDHSSSSRSTKLLLMQETNEKEREKCSKEKSSLDGSLKQELVTRESLIDLCIICCW